MPGVGEVRVDALGRVTSDRRPSRPAEPGLSVQLTLDAELQRVAEDAIAYGIRLAHEDGEWAAYGGAIVAMQPDTGEILALASNPTFDPSVYVGRVRPKALARLADPASNHPTLNRAITGLYPPGSTFKPITALAAMHEGLLSPSETIQCTGQMEVGEDKQIFRNWDPFKNEPMELTTALANSCDTYFYEVALRAYERPDSPIQKWSRRMGFGTTTGIDLGPEAAGLIPTPEWRRRHFKEPTEKVWTNGDSVQLGIGQGDVLVTPLQMTRFYALLANGGKLVEPRIVKQVEQPGTEGDTAIVVRPFTAPKPKDIGLDPAAVSIVQEGSDRRDPHVVRHIHERLRRLPGPHRRQDRHGGEVRHDRRLVGHAGPVVVVRLGSVRRSRARRLRHDRERRPRRRGRRPGRAQALRELLRCRAGHLPDRLRGVRLVPLQH